MSSQKEKHLISAQKFIQKGQFDRALRDYEQIVAADPKDVKHRQKLAELLVRCNRREDAVREYETIAKYYDENGFYLKAIAVYKQIQRLDPANIDVCLSLAQLNEKQGMIGNALSEYKVIFDHHERDGNLTAAIKVLEKMQAVDPENVEIRLKLAETLYSTDCTDRAYGEFSRVALTLRSRANTDFAERVARRIEKLFPERGDSSLNHLAAQIAGGSVGEALPQVRQLLEQDPDNPRLLGLLGEACRHTGDWAARRAAMERLLRAVPGDPGAIRGLVEATMDSGDHEASVAMITAQGTALAGAGLQDDLERCLTTLLAQSPYDVRLLEALQDLYENTGDAVKLADVTASLAILSQPAAGDDAAVADGGDAAFTAPLADADGFVWGDEIDLAAASTPDMPEAVLAEPVAGPAEYGLVDLAVQDAPEAATVPDGFEIDISFELPDDVAVFSPGAVEDPLLSLPVEPELTEVSAAAIPGGDELDQTSQGDASQEEAAEPAFPPLEDFGLVDLAAADTVELEAVTAGSAGADTVAVSLDFDSAEDIFASADAANGSDHAVATGERESIEPAGEADAAAVDLERYEAIHIPESIVDSPAVVSGLPETDDELLLDGALIPDLPELSLKNELSGLPVTGEESPFVLPAGDGTGDPSGKYAFDGLFARFKEGLDQQVASDDTETHYDLGIAYMEMGLYDDAIKEFLIAATDPRRTLDCLTLQGVCCRDKGDLETAGQCFTAGLSLDGLDADRIVSLRYELALLYQVSGRREAALQAFREVFALNPGFRDTMQRIAHLSGKEELFDLSDFAEADLELESLE